MRGACVRAGPGGVCGMRGRLGGREHAGVEVHERKGYKLVVTIEADTVDASSDTAGSFVGIPGVLGVNLVYCNFEDDPTL